ncbi:MAG: TonB-dependent receptor plug domain-containing protein, partial [Desulfobacterales bacterium]|nr:TonB-dependent receptor plug domain-containing protein [Desulfobacterales bacterium]
MKKKLKLSFHVHESFKRFVRTMKTTVLLVLICVTGAMAANTYAQNTKLSINVKNTALRDVIQIIEDQTEFYFLYKDEILDVSREVNLNVKNASINDVLKQILPTDEVNYSLRDRQILILDVNKSVSQNVVFQIKKIVGTVTDSSGSPLPGATVVVKGTTQGTVTGDDGSYALFDVAEDATLVFSFIGMKTQEVFISGETVINVVMVDEAIGIEEVVAVGYGVQKKVNVTGSVDVVAGEKLANRSAQNVSLLLQGTSPNVEIVRNLHGGEPGAEQRWQIRGIGSIEGNTSPLVLVDGVEMDINLIDPESIENISVLKDASASAIYGSRAAFGVVLVTTKKGKVDQPMQIQYSNLLTFAIPIYVPDMYDSYTYAIAFNQARANAGLTPTFPDEQVERIKGYIDGTYPFEYDPDNPPTSIWGGRWQGNSNVNW